MKKTYKYYSISVFLALLIIIGVATDLLNGFSFDVWELIVFIAVVIMTIFSFTYKVAIDDKGMEISAPLFFINMKVILWKDIKRIKNGPLFKEVEFRYKGRSYYDSLSISGLSYRFKDPLYKVIMEKLGQKVIDR